MCAIELCFDLVTLTELFRVGMTNRKVKYML